MLGDSAGGHLALRLALDAAATDDTDGRMREVIAGTVRGARGAWTKPGVQKKPRVSQVVTI